MFTLGYITKQKHDNTCNDHTINCMYSVSPCIFLKITTITHNNWMPSLAIFQLYRDVIISKWGSKIIKGIQAVRIDFFYILKVANIWCFILIAVEIFHNIIRK